MAGPILPTTKSATLPAVSEAGQFDLATIDEAPGKANNARRLLSVLSRFRWWLVLGGVLGCGLGVVISRVVPSKYLADSTVWIETRDMDHSENTTGPIRPGGFLESRQWPELLQSYSVIDSVVRGLKLYLVPETATDQDVFEEFGFADQFGYGLFRVVVSKDGKTYALDRAPSRLSALPLPSFLRGEGIVVERGQVGDSIGRNLGWRWAPTAQRLPAGKVVEFEITTPREASQDLMKRLTATVQGQQFIRLTLKERDPERAALVLNTITVQFVKVATRLKTQKLIEQRDVLQQQTDFSYQRLKQAELALQNFRVSTVTLPTLNTPVVAGLQMTQPTVMADYFEKKRRADAIRGDRQSILDLLARNSRGEFTVDAFQTVPSVQNAPDLKAALAKLSVVEAELMSARLRYTDSMKVVKDLREQIETLRAKAIPQLAHALADQLDRTANTLDSQIASQSVELTQIPERSTNEQRLTREYEAADALFKLLRSRLEAARLAEASEIPDLRAMDPAVPPRKPSGIPKPLFVLGGLILGLGLVAGFTLVRDLLDRRIQYPEQVSGGSIGLTILGVVPDARGVRGVAQRELNNQVVEAFREIRLNIVHSAETPGPIALTVSSPSPQDGKSFVCANLAVSFAEAGYRTILIDGDTRRGSLHNSFRCDRKPGLIDYLVGTAEIDAVLRPTSHSGLTLIPSGERTSQSPELLGSLRMKELFDFARSNYDVVLIDSPPFAAGVDPYILGTVTGSLLAVLRSGQTNRELAEAKLRVLDRLPVRQLGAVLNAVTFGTESYRYYGYVEGYSANDEGDQRQVSSGAAKMEQVDG